MASQSLQLHFTLFPFMAPGHMIPMTSPNCWRSAASSSPSSPHPTPPASAPPSIAPQQLDSKSDSFKSVSRPPKPAFPKAARISTLSLSSLQKDVAQIFEEMQPPPSCIISDMGLPWTTKIAKKFNIPRIVFHGTCCFSLLCPHNIRASGILDTLDSPSDCFEVPNVPGKIVMRKCQADSFMARQTNVAKDVSDQIRAAEKASYGVVVNSFEDLEADHVSTASRIALHEECTMYN